MKDPDPAVGALANVLGAFALVITDELHRRIAVAAERPSITDATALSALEEFLDGATLNQLHEVLGVTPSGAVRLIDRLVEAELVSRETGPDKRSRAIWLTEDGHRRAHAVRSARSAYLGTLAESLSADEVATLRDLLRRLMSSVVGMKDGGPWTCRLCDLVACRRPQGECPTYNAVVTTT